MSVAKEESPLPPVKSVRHLIFFSRSKVKSRTDLHCARTDLVKSRTDLTNARTENVKSRRDLIKGRTDLAGGTFPSACFGLFRPGSDLDREGPRTGRGTLSMHDHMLGP
ncbi:MAG: hypothetical protein EA377_06020 [Phycisphaerales bacterium]|nr:MAG: hypothetical protein EA377_06020 [Phycisphaerales bacterium]